MNRVRAALVCALIVGCVSHPPHKTGLNDTNDPTGQSVRLRFVPGSAPSSPLESCDGAVWGTLGPFPNSSKSKTKTIFMHASANIGSEFPVARRDGPTLFDVRLKDGDDDRLILEVVSKRRTKTIEVKRDCPVKTRVEGVEYRFSYPSVEMAAKDGKTTTNKATILVSTRE